MAYKMIIISFTAVIILNLITITYYYQSTVVGAIDFRKYAIPSLLPAKSMNIFDHGIIQDNHIQYPNPYEVIFSPRTVGSMFDFGFQISNSDLCPKNGEDIYLLILIESSLPAKYARTAIRKTYGSFNSTRIKVAFLLGRTNSPNLQRVVREESEQFKDVVVANFVDRYRNLTLKTFSLFSWVVQYCYKATYVLKTDDDVYVNMRNLLRVLKNKRQGTILGKVNKHPKVHRTPGDKWFVAWNQFSAEKFPPYTVGLGYVIAVIDIEKIVKEALDSTFIWLEDVFFTGIIAKKLGFLFQNNRRFRYSLHDPCLSSQVVLVHLHGNYNKMYFMHRFRKKSHSCKTDKYSHSHPNTRKGWRKNRTGQNASSKNRRRNMHIWKSKHKNIQNYMRKQTANNQLLTNSTFY